MLAGTEEKEGVLEMMRVGACYIDNVDIRVVGEVCVSGVCCGGGGGVDVGQELTG